MEPPLPLLFLILRPLLLFRSFDLSHRSTFSHSLAPSTQSFSLLFPRASSRALFNQCIYPFLQFLLLPKETTTTLQAQQASSSAGHNVLRALCLYKCGSIWRAVVCSVAAFRESRQLPLISEKISLLEHDSSNHVFPSWWTVDIYFCLSSSPPITSHV